MLALDMAHKGTHPQNCESNKMCNFFFEEFKKKEKELTLLTTSDSLKRDLDNVNSRITASMINVVSSTDGKLLALRSCGGFLFLGGVSAFKLCSNILSKITPRSCLHMRNSCLPQGFPSFP